MPRTAREGVLRVCTESHRSLCPHRALRERATFVVHRARERRPSRLRCVAGAHIFSTLCTWRHRIAQDESPIVSMDAMILILRAERCEARVVHPLLVYGTELVVVSACARSALGLAHLQRVLATVGVPTFLFT